MTVQPVAPSYHRPDAPNRRKPAGRPIAPETPPQVIEGESYEISAESIYYRDDDRVNRLHGDAGCDDAVRRMERAFETGDRAAFHAAADDYWLADADEDAAAACGDVRVSVIHLHAQVIAAACVEVEMGATSIATGRERGAATRRGGRRS